MAGLILLPLVIVINLLSAYERRQRFRRYVSLLRDGARRVDDIAAATGLRRKVVEKDLRKLAKKGKDIFRGAYFNEATQEICLASLVAPAARWNNAPAQPVANWNNAPTQPVATWNNASANAPANWNNAPAQPVANWNNAPAQPVANWNNAPAQPAANWNNAPAQPVANWNNAPANAPATWNNAPANAPAQPVAPRNVVCSACGASVTLVGDKRVCEYCGSPLN